ncbi:universal stress protein [Desulfomicrobium escambiense]|uniref:universal stress protein n=1 Tax=Desulfomicrobium escambiense TaxID=29503 RepID=UPI000404BCFE|nr:universal stress protein [Desulfomicrobium escambiense]
MKILAAIDQSEYATLVLTKAMKLAAQEGAALTALTVSNAPYTNLYLGEISGEFLDKMREGVQKTVSRAQEQAKAAGAKVDVVVEESPSAADAIVKYAEKNKIDLIVIGNKGAGAVERFLIGSVSSQVVTHAPCSVLVVKK